MKNSLNLPQAIVRAVLNDPYTKGDAEYSITELLNPPRARELKRRHADELEEEVADVIYRLLGKLGHLMVQQAAEGTNDIVEHILYGYLNGKKVKGQMDLIEGAIWDWKFTSVWTTANGVKPEWTAQLNGLRWLCSENGITVPEELFIGAIYRDWSKAKAKWARDYPRMQVETFRVDVWDMDKTKEYFSDRIQKMEDAKLELPECTLAERWATMDTWKVKKTIGGRAVRGGVFTTPVAAEAFAKKKETPKKKYVVEMHPGESRRCAEYCLASSVCDQWKAMSASDEPEEDGELF